MAVTLPAAAVVRYRELGYDFVVITDYGASFVEIQNALTSTTRNGVSADEEVGMPRSRAVESSLASPATTLTT